MGRNRLRRRVVVTGLGAISALGHDVAENWAACRAGRSGVGPITLFDPAPFETRFAAEVAGFDAVKAFGAREARRMDRFTQFALAAAGQALAQSGLAITPENEWRAGVIVGSGVGGLQTTQDAAETLRARGPRRMSPHAVPMLLPDSAAGVIAIHHRLKGPNLAVVSACASGSNAIGEAALMIAHGRADAMLAGGAEAGITSVALAAFNAMTAISRRNDAPQRASRPFDAERDGFVMGEGAAMLVLEERDAAVARGARVLAEVLGYGCSEDAYHATAPAEDGRGAAQAMRLALADAGLAPQDVDYLNAHGTSTVLNDRAETTAIKSVFGAYAYRVPVSSTKSMHGHLLGAAGALEAVLCIKALEAQVVPPTINYEYPDPACDLDYVPNTARPAHLRTILKNSFGFGGHNACLVLGYRE